MEDGHLLQTTKLKNLVLFAIKHLWQCRNEKKLSLVSELLVENQDISI